MPYLPYRQSSSRQRSLDLVDDARKSGHVVHSDVAEHFAVDFDIGLLQAIGKLAVGHAALARCRVDTGNPQLAENTLFGTAIAVGILPRLHHRFFGDPENIAAATAETFGKGENFFCGGREPLHHV